MIKPDITYKKDHFFTIFYPESPEGEKVYQEIAGLTEGTGMVAFYEADDFISRLRKAGYVVHKHKSVKIDISDDEILKELQQ